MIILAAITALCLGFSVGVTIVAITFRRNHGAEFNKQVVDGIADEYAQMWVGMLIALKEIEKADDPATEARHTRTMMEMTMTAESGTSWNVEDEQ